MHDSNKVPSINHLRARQTARLRCRMISSMSWVLRLSMNHKSINLKFELLVFKTLLSKQKSPFKLGKIN